MRNVHQLLEKQRQDERDFARQAALEADPPIGWTYSQLLFHFARWRERLRDALTQLQATGQAVSPPDDIDGVNASELDAGRRVTLAEAAARSDAAAGQLIELCAVLGDRPFKWYRAETAAEAAIRNGYFHPRNHIAEHFIELGDRARGNQILESTVAGLRSVDAPGHTLGPAILNVACIRAVDGGRGAEASRGSDTDARRPPRDRFRRAATSVFEGGPAQRTPSLALTSQTLAWH